jgi:putative nucleotidyltransferase with HDIG domain
MPKGEIRDPVHGFVHRKKVESDIIDTPVFQRLRGIKQLALANLVYPGAIHTRFDHSIGVMHVAGKMAEHLEVDDEDVRLLRLAALLHDIGHGPFSHISEDSLAKFCDRSSIEVDATDKIHEDITAKIILCNKEIGKLISSKDREKIVNLLKGKNTYSVLTSIVSGPLDADKQDYLLRDSYFCGVKYGVFDMARLHNTLRVYDDSQDRYLAIAEDGMHALEQYVLAKYYLTTNIYRHKVRLITDAMLTRGIQLGIEKDNIEFLKRLYSYDGTEKYLRNYIKWNDSRLMQEILKRRKGYAKDIFAKLKKRQLFKRVYTSRIDEGAFPTPKTRAVLSDLPKEPQLKVQIEKAIANYLGVDPLLVIVFAFKIRFVGRDTELSPVNILSSGKPVPFEEASTLFYSIKKAMDDFYLEVYAPVIYTPAEKRQKLKEWKEQVRGLIVKVVEESKREVAQ